MKKGKLFLPTIMMVAAIVMTMVSVMIAGISLKPVVTEGEFPFSITYELDGQTVTIQDVYQVHYDADEAYKYRVYVGEIQNKEENNTYYTLKTEENGRIELWTRFYADYLMGDLLCPGLGSYLAMCSLGTDNYRSPDRPARTVSS